MKIEILSSLCQDLAKIEQEAKSADRYRLIAQTAAAYRVEPVLAQRLVQFHLSGRSHDTPTSGTPVKSIRSDVIEICLGKACRARGADKIKSFYQVQIQKNLQDPTVKPVKLKTCSCLHHCGKAPIVLVNGKLHEKFTIQE